MARTGHAQLQQPQAAGLRDGRRSGRDVQLGQDIGDVPVDGVLADEEPLRNGLIVEAGRNQSKDLDLVVSSGLSGRPAFPAARLPGSSSGHRATVRARASLQAGAERRQVVDGATDLVDGRSGRPSAPSTRASSTRARPVSNGAPLSLNRSTASSRCGLADFGSPDRAATRPAARLANARSGPVRASSAMAWSSATACVASSVAVLFQAGANHQLERSRALGPILQRQATEVPLGEIRGGLEIAAIEDRRSRARARRADAIQRARRAPWLRRACPGAAAILRGARAPRPSSPGGDAASSSAATVSSRSASSHAPRHMHTEAYWVRHTAKSGRNPHFAQNALRRSHHCTARS